MINLENQKKMNELMSLYDKAIGIVEKYVNKFEQESEEKNLLLIKELKNGLDVLKCGKANKKDNYQWLEEKLKIPKRERGGFGLSRGFGEFLWQGYDWQDEILDSVGAIEDYYREM